MSADLEPQDLQAEGAICSLLLRGESTPERLLPLEPHHHFSPAHRGIHEAATAVATRGEVVEMDTIAQELERLGVAGDFREDLAEMRAFSPVLTVKALDASKSRVIELWRRRELLRELARVRSALRVGDASSGSVRARLERFFQELG